MITESLYKEYLQLLIEGKKGVCTDIVKTEMEKQTPVISIYLDLFQRSMYEIGSLWENNRISVAAEHMTTAITESLLHIVYPLLLTAPRINKKAIIACGCNEYHQLGAKITADYFESKGWDTFFLGANTPTSDLITMISQESPQLIGLSLSVYFHLPVFIETIQSIHEQFPSLDILIGGQAFLHGGINNCLVAPQVQYINSLHALEKVLINEGRNDSM